MFYITATLAHCPVIQKETDELLVKGAFEQATGDAGFYSSDCMVPTCTGDL